MKFGRHYITLHICEVSDVYKHRREISCRKAWWTKQLRRLFRITYRHGREYFWMFVTDEELELVRAARAVK